MSETMSRLHARILELERELEASMIRVPQVIREMGIEPTPKLCTTVGQRFQRFYTELTGLLPPKHNRDKTYDTGNHCFALYEECFRLKIQSLVYLYQFEETYQPLLFSAPPPLKTRTRPGVDVELML